MLRQLPSLLRAQSWLSILVLCGSFTAACGGVSDAIDESGAGSSPGGSSPGASAAGTTAQASGGSVAGAGQVIGVGGSGNSPGSGGNFPFAGAGGQLSGGAGALATGGVGGAGGARFGSGGTAGTRAGAGGTGGSGGSKSTTGGTGGSAGSAPTWTEVYTKFLSNAQYASNCNGAACHNPGKQRGFDFSTKANGYACVKSKTSQLVSVLSSGSMPQGKPKMPAADLAIVKAWVAAGALDN